jgi:hypothetical protein
LVGFMLCEQNPPSLVLIIIWGKPTQQNSALE